LLPHQKLGLVLRSWVDINKNEVHMTGLGSKTLDLIFRQSIFSSLALFFTLVKQLLIYTALANLR
jgi:hypothetical protein